MCERLDQLSVSAYSASRAKRAARRSNWHDIQATVSPVHGASRATTAAAADGTHLRVVSMPCLELFLAEDEAYRRQVLGQDLPIIAVEMGRPEIWCQLTGSLDRVIGVTSFGASAPSGDLADHFGFTAPKVTAALKEILEHCAVNR